MPGDDALAMERAVPTCNDTRALTRFAAGGAALLLWCSFLLYFLARPYEARRAAVAEEIEILKSALPAGGVPAILTLAKKYIAACLYEDASQCLEQATQRYPEETQLYFTLGNVLLLQKRFRAAHKAFHKAAELKPDHAQAFYNMGLIDSTFGVYNRCVASFTRVIELEPENREAYAYLIDALLATGRNQEADQAQKRLKAIEAARAASAPQR